MAGIFASTKSALEVIAENVKVPSKNDKTATGKRKYSSMQELKISLFEYINGFYNSLRPHSHNNGLSPNNAESSYFSA